MISNDIKDELSTNFIEYSVAVNTDRSIPDARSGLKPVARRILWDAYVEGYTSNRVHVKSAKVVGSCLGRWHPHGDSSVYEAMVRLSQSWVMRYPLIDIHGNNGNISGDGAASSRYTEARLSKIAEDGLLVGLKKKNVEFMPNYSEDEEEPVTLPSIFPNLLCNPNSGIGVAVACSWLPNNLNEVAQAINDYLDGKEPMLPGPDFPTGGLVINKNDIPVIIRTGHGSVKVRGKYKIEKKNTIVFYEIPYGQTIEGLLNEISDVCDKKEIEGIIEIRDESNKKGLRIVVQCDKDIDPESIVKKLFAKTNLQTSISYNQVALVNKTPTELNLKDCIKIYVEHNLDCLQREATFDLTKAEDRLNIVEGLLIALEDIDNVIAKIKASESAVAAKERLMSDYNMNEVQAKAVLDMRLSKLAKLEKIEVQKEKEELINTIDKLNFFLTHQEEQIKELRKRLSNIVQKYGDERRTELTQIDEIPEKQEKEKPKIIPEDVVVIVTQSGDIKRIPRTAFRAQRKNTKGIKSEDNAILDTISTNTEDTLMFFTSIGKMYKMSVNNIPVGTNVSKGVKINTLISMGNDEKVIAVSSLYKKTKAQYALFITKQGMIKKTYLEEYMSVRKNAGTAAIKLKEGDTLANVTFINEEEIIIITKKGMSIHFSTDSITPIGRIALGVKSIKLTEDDEVVVGLPIHKSTDNIAIFTSNGFGKKCSINDFPYQSRAGKGTIIYKQNDIIGSVVGAAMVDDNDFILLIGRPTSICITAKDIPLMTKLGNGNKMIKDSTVMSIVKL